MRQAEPRDRPEVPTRVSVLGRRRSKLLGHVAGLPTTQSWQERGFLHSESFGVEVGEEGKKH